MSMERKKRVTHRDVARRANVSTAVVSYVINNGPRPTSPETRARVLQAIRELDYHPNAFARSLNTQQTHIIGFITHDVFGDDLFISPYSAAILSGVMAELKAHEHYLLTYSQVIGEDVAALEKLLRSGRLDGVIVRLVQDPPATDQLLKTIAATKLPCMYRTPRRGAIWLQSRNLQRCAWCEHRNPLSDRARASSHRASTRRPALRQCTSMASRLPASNTRRRFTCGRTVDPG